MIEIVPLLDRTIHTVTLSSREQASLVAEVNGSIARLDQLTQRNAVMVEETEAASWALSGEADFPMDVIDRFDLGENSDSPSETMKAA